MLPVSNHVRFSNARIRSEKASSKDTTKRSDEQLRAMPAPKGVNTLQWALSNPSEKRALLDSRENSDSTSDMGTESSSQGQVNAATLKTTVINQDILEQLIVVDSVNDTIQYDAIKEKQSLTTITRQFKQQFIGNAQNKTAFHQLIKNSFGSQYDVTKAEGLRQRALKGDFTWMPKIQLLNTTQLADTSSTQGQGIGRGAYSASKDTIYLNRQLLNSNPSMAAKILTEEMGHAIDVRINTTDAAGDEGDIFSRLSRGETISSAQLAKLKTENDSGTIKVNGATVDVEYGFFKKFRRKIKRAVKKVGRGIRKLGKGVTRGIRKIGKGITRGIKRLGKKVRGTFKRIGKGVFRFVKTVRQRVVRGIKKVTKGIINAHKKIANKIKTRIKRAARSIKKGFKKVMQSKLFGQILMVAQFIPIPIVQIAVRIANVVRAAYSVYQGVKNKSWSAVLGGIASVAGGIGKVAGSLGATASFVTKAASIANKVNTASKVYSAISEKNFAAAASIAANYFGGNSKVSGVINNVVKADIVYKAAKRGDYLGAVGVGADLLQNINGNHSDALLNKVGTNARVLKGVEQAVNTGNYGTAASILASNYGDNLNLSDSAQHNIQKVTQTFQRIESAKTLIDSHDYASAAQILLQAANENSSNDKTRNQLMQASRVIRQVDSTARAVKEGRYAQAIALAADTLNKPLDDNTRKVVNTLQQTANQFNTIRRAVKQGNIAATSNALGKLGQLLKLDPQLTGSLLKVGDISTTINQLQQSIKANDIQQASRLAAHLSQSVGGNNALSQTLGQFSQILNTSQQTANGQTPGINPIGINTIVPIPASFTGQGSVLSLNPGYPTQSTDNNAGLTQRQQELMLDITQVSLDLAGIVDPTGIADGTNAAISLKRGDYLGAAISAVGLIPFIGDLAKFGKVGRWANTVLKVAEEAATNSAFAKKVEPLLNTINDAVTSIPASIKNRLPASAQKKLDEIHEKILDLQAGKKGGWNKGLNGKLKTNAQYRVGDNLYKTDDLGRVENVTAKLNLNKHDRNTYQQVQAGKTDGIKDGLDNDEGGHIIASIFDGPGEQINYVPMDANLNRRAWKSMETVWKKALESGKKVEVDIQMVYSGSSKRPDRFVVKYKIDGERFRKPFLNQKG